MTVRAAHVSDWAGIFLLLRELVGETADADATAPELATRFADYLARDDTIALVAEHDAEIVGFVVMEFRSLLLTDRPYAQMRNLVIAPHARRSGIGRALIGTLEEVARASGCTFIGLDSSTDRVAAHQLFRQTGFRVSGTAFMKDL